MTVNYQGGEKKVVVPEDTPVVTFEPGVLSGLKPGAHVIVFVHAGPNRTTLADRVLVGKNGLVPPM